MKNLYAKKIPGQQDVKQPDDVPMILCHMSKDELIGLDTMQGGKMIDEPTGLRTYPKLASIIEIPMVKDFFDLNFEYFKKNKKLPPVTKEIYEKVKIIEPRFVDAPQDKVPIASTIEKMGKGDDKKLVYLPINFVLHLLEGMGATTADKFPINSKTGLLQFGFWKEVVRGAGTIVGFMVGGPGGAAIGNAIAHKVTGADWGKSLKRGLTAGIGSLGYVAGGPLGAGLGTALGTGVIEGKSWQKSLMQGLKIGALTYGGDQLLGGAEGLTSLASGNGAGGYLGSLTGSTAAASTGANTAGLTAAQAGQQIANQSLTNAAASSGASSGLSGLLSKAGDFATSPLGLSAIVGGASLMGEKHKIKEQNKQAELNNAAYERMRNDAGLNLPPIQMSGDDNSYVKNPNYDHDNNEPFYIRGKTQKYKEGGVVRQKAINPYNSRGIFGPGNGQDDSIRTRIPSGTYIIDASTTSDLGDGSSTAGLKVLQKTVKQIRSQYPKHVIRHVEKIVKKDSKHVPVYVANEEFPIDPVTVALKGGGSVERGAKVFDQMVKNIRAHKNSKGLSLPPRAKQPLQYLRG